jgi:hypothetical protein
MAVVTRKSAVITARDQASRALSDSELFNARKKVAKGLITITSGDSATSKYLVCPIPSNAIIHSVKLSCPDIGTTTTADVGLYKSTLDGGAVVDADFFSAAVSLKDGALAKSEVVNGNVLTVANMEKRIWEALGLSVDPGLMYDVVLTLVGAADAGGAVFVEIEYV